MPRVVWDAVAARTGRLLSVVPAGAGSACDWAGTVHTTTGQVFVKATRTDSPAAWTLRNTIRVADRLPAGVAQRVCWHVETDGWLVLALEHVPGQHADLRPGSPDLPAVATALTSLATRQVTGVRPFTTRWEGLIDPAVVAGQALVHGDMSRRNWLVNDGQAQLVDWSTPAVGAAWIDTALMVIRLIRYGHTPEQAERWASAVPAWGGASEDAVSAFVAAAARLLAARLESSGAAHLAPLVGAARAWGDFRTVAV